MHSSDGADVTTIDATGLNSPVITCAGDERADLTMGGITVTCGTGREHEDYVSGGGVFCIGNNLTLSDCVFICNDAEKGAGMYAEGGDLVMTGCRFESNTANLWGGGIYASAGC